MTHSGKHKVVRIPIKVVRGGGSSLVPLSAAGTGLLATGAAGVLAARRRRDAAEVATA